MRITCNVVATQIHRQQNALSGALCDRYCDSRRDLTKKRIGYHYTDRTDNDISGTAINNHCIFTSCCLIGTCLYHRLSCKNIRPNGCHINVGVSFLYTFNNLSAYSTALTVNNQYFHSIYLTII